MTVAGTVLPASAPDGEGRGSQALPARPFLIHGNKWAVIRDGELQCFEFISNARRELSISAREA